MGLAKKRRKEKKEFRWLRGILLPIIGMLAMAFVISLSVFYMWTTPEFPLPGPSDSEAWVIWQSLGKIFPFFIVVPGLIFWFVVLRPKLKAEEVAVEKLDIPVAD
jgi:amino acid transporter